VSIACSSSAAAAAATPSSTSAPSAGSAGAATSGRGVVYSYSVLYSVGDPVLKEELPYALAIVELDEGARLLTRIVGDPDAVAVGRRVRVVFHDVDEELTLPYFALEEDDA